jgi:hypothetical protein
MKSLSSVASKFPVSNKVSTKSGWLWPSLERIAQNTQDVERGFLAATILCQIQPGYDQGFSASFGTILYFSPLVLVPRKFSSVAVRGGEAVGIADSTNRIGMPHNEIEFLSLRIPLVGLKRISA